MYYRLVLLAEMFGIEMDDKTYALIAFGIVGVIMFVSILMLTIPEIYKAKAKTSRAPKRKTWLGEHLEIPAFRNTILAVLLSALIFGGSYYISHFI